jgi:hypothetical protein
VKDAKSEAQKEIEDYRSQKESDFKTFETEVSPTAERSLALQISISDRDELRTALVLGHH